jgi:N-formylmaleamate deformylase
MSPSDSFLYGGHVRANGIRQHYLRYGGRGQPLVLIPGITSPAATWGFVGERFGHSFDTYILDVRGRGLSQGGANLDYGLDACAEDVAGLADALKLERVVVVGHSLGARIAARVGSRHGSYISRLVLADPPLSGPGRRPYVRSLEFYLGPIRQAQAGTFDLEALRRTYPNWTEAQLRLRAEWLHTCDEAAIAASHRGLQEEEIHSDLREIRAPTLLMVAGKGGVISDEDIRDVRELMPQILVKKVQDATHQIPFDNFEGFFAAMDDFLVQG